MADDLNITNEGINLEENTSQVETPIETPVPVTAPVETIVNPNDIQQSADMNVSGNNLRMPNNSAKTEMSSPNVVAFDEPYPGMGNFDVKTFEDAVTFATEGMPNMEINQPFRDMIDAAAVDFDKYPGMFANNDMNDLYPGRSTDNFDPFRQSSGIPDLNTANGRKAYMSQTQAFVKQEHTCPRHRKSNAVQHLVCAHAD